MKSKCEKSKVSIIMGIYNCENTLEESIDSIIKQTYKNWELILCDDCSTDNTYNVALKYVELYPDKIKLIKNDRNLTLGPTLNKCLKLATGDYIARHDGDDLYLEDKLEKQVDFLESHEDIDLVGTGMRIFDENGVYGKRGSNKEPKAIDLMMGVTFSHATIMAKASVYRELNGYSESLNRRGVEDYDLWFRFFEKGFKGYNLDDVLYEVREDRNAYKRKNIRRRKNEIKTIINGRKLIGLSFKYNFFILKPIIAMLIPSKILMKYHRKQLEKVNN